MGKGLILRSYADTLGASTNPTRSNRPILTRGEILTAVLDGR